MISAEQELLVIEQCHTARSVAWDRNGLEPVGERHMILPFDNPFGSRNSVRITSMNDSLGAEMRRVFIGIGDIVLMRQKDIREAATPLKRIDQMLEISG